jgi:ABC-type branched-subunit amino acid transport system permease subunit
MTVAGAIIGRLSPGLVVPLGVGLVLLFGLPHWIDLFTLLQVTLYVIMAILALSLGFIWGYGGIICLGQSAFFGLGAYAYAIAAFNIGESTIPVIAALVVPAAFAAAFGYFMFYGRVSGVYVGVMTLTLALILFNAINSTAGPQYHIGKAPLGGYNGLPNVPGLNFPFDASAGLEPDDMYYLSMGLLLFVYFGLRWLLTTRFGRVVVAIRENEQRVEFIGFDARLHKLVAFTIGGALAGLAGCLFVNWGSYVSPVIFSMIQSAQIIIWVMVGGVGTLIGPVLGAVALSWLTAEVGTQQLLDANLLFGAILLVFVLFVPRGILPMLTEKVWSRLAKPRSPPAKPAGLAAPGGRA